MLIEIFRSIIKRKGVKKSMEFRRKLTTAFAAGALLFSSFATPALAGTTIEISGNGSSSTNDAQVTLEQQTTVVQENNADINNYVEVSADTGSNDANDNTGGDVDIDTGDATVDVSVSNTVNSNTASVDCCPTGDTEVLISGNGTGSDNDAELNMANATELFQSNNADVQNTVFADAKTGRNDADDNTGGSVSIDTGDATVTTSLSTTANANWAQVGGNGNGGGSVSLRILGNGSDSDNDIKLELANETLLVQENNADVNNYVWGTAKTGENDANDNTGGDVDIDTGDATVDVEVDNLVNFNWAAADCGCLLDDLLAKISGNGTDSENDIRAEVGQALEVFQGNCTKDQEWEHGEYGDCEIDNTVFADALTGRNDADDNTGDPDGDPSVDTGDAETNVDLDNSGNVNVYGADSEFDFPDFDFDLSITIDLSDLLDLLLG